MGEVEWWVIPSISTGMRDTDPSEKILIKISFTGKDHFMLCFLLIFYSSAVPTLQIVYSNV